MHWCAKVLNEIELIFDLNFFALRIVASVITFFKKKLKQCFFHVLGYLYTQMILTTHELIDAYTWNMPVHILSSLPSRALCGLNKAGYTCFSKASKVQFQESSSCRNICSAARLPPPVPGNWFACSFQEGGSALHSCFMHLSTLSGNRADGCMWLIDSPGGVSVCR